MRHVHDRIEDDFLGIDGGFRPKKWGIAKNLGDYAGKGYI